MARCKGRRPTDGLPCTRLKLHNVAYIHPASIAGPHRECEIKQTYAKGLVLQMWVSPEPAVLFHSLSVDSRAERGVSV